MTEISRDELISRQGMVIYEIPSRNNDGFFDLVVTDTELESVQINPNFPSRSLLNLEKRRKENAKGYIPGQVVAFGVIADGFRGGVLEGDAIGGSVEVMAGLIIELGIQFRGLRIQQRIDLLRDELRFRIETAYRELFTSGKRKTATESTQEPVSQTAEQI